MPHFVTDRCINCKHTDCVEVCPVNCFYEGKNMLVIHPDECIDCGACIPECPVDAIVFDQELDEMIFTCNDESLLSEEQILLKKMFQLNKKYSVLWPNITTKKPEMDKAAEFRDKENKLDYFVE